MPSRTTTILLVALAGCGGTSGGARKVIDDVIFAALDTTNTAVGTFEIDLDDVRFSD